MPDRLDHLERLIEELRENLGAVERRLDEIEAGMSATRRRPDPVLSAPVSNVSVAAGGFNPVVGLTLLGRTFLVLGGAFLIRALTDSGVFSSNAGVVAGLAYALVWLTLCDWKAGWGDGISAVSHGLAALLVAYPLILETTGRMHLVSPVAGISAFVVWSFLGLGVAWRRRLRPFSWGVVLGSAGVGLVLLQETRSFLFLTAFFLAFEPVAAWVAYSRSWVILKWPATFVATALVFLGVMMVPSSARGVFGELDPRGVEAAAAAFLFFQTFALALYMLARGKRVDVYTVVRSVLAVGVGLGGVLRIAAVTDRAIPWFGAVVLVLGLASYAVAFGVVDRRLGPRENFHYFTWYGLILVLVGGTVLTGGLAWTLGLCFLALIGVWLGRRYDRFTPRAHGSLLGLIAAFQGGLVGVSLKRFYLAADRAWPSMPVSAWAALGTGIAGYLLIVASRNVAIVRWPRRLPRFGLAVVVVGGVAGLLVREGLRLPGEPPPTADPATVACVRTLVLAGCAVLLSLGGKSRRLSELAWLVYPLIGIGGLKFLVEDIPHGRPLTLFIGFFGYGAMLIAASRMMRIRRGPVRRETPLSPGAAPGQ